MKTLSTLCRRVANHLQVERRRAPAATALMNVRKRTEATVIEFLIFWRKRATGIFV